MPETSAAILRQETRVARRALRFLSIGSFLPDVARRERWDLGGTGRERRSRPPGAPVLLRPSAGSGDLGPEMAVFCSPMDSLHSVRSGAALSVGPRLTVAESLATFGDRRKSLGAENNSCVPPPLLTILDKLAAWRSVVVEGGAAQSQITSAGRIQTDRRWRMQEADASPLRGVGSLKRHRDFYLIILNAFLDRWLHCETTSTRKTDKGAEKCVLHSFYWFFHVGCVFLHFLFDFVFRYQFSRCLWFRRSHASSQWFLSFTNDIIWLNKRLYIYGKYCFS